MASTITAFDAKNRLGQILDRVASGEEITITRHGEPVAMLVPLAIQKTDAVAQALQMFKGIRGDLAKRGKKISRREVRKWIDEGRR